VRRLLVVAIGVLSLWAAPGAFAATWCGSGESAIDRPDVVTGQQIHSIYVVPADGADTFPTGVQTMASDIASITSWWQGQDPTRIPRFDLATFPGGTCADITFYRLPETSAALATGNAAQSFSLLEDELALGGYENPGKKYLVYYDGPPVEPDVCGTGAGDFSTGPSFAVVWLQGCPGLPTDAIAAHELLHALGALPAGAPNACTPATDPFGVADSGHPCDSPTDVLYPVSSGLPLSQLVLDYNHDDYYDHSGSWDDIADSLWMHLLQVPEIPLAVTVGGSGTGEVFSDVPGLDCTASCTTHWDQGWRVNLTASPNSGSRFIGWSGACAGEETCALELSAPTSATALFGPARVPLRLSVAGKGRITCTPQCRATAAAGEPLVLRAWPAKGWKFARWTGGCKGSALDCRPATGAAVAVRATFTKRAAKPKPKKKR
jgi:hypothetical protein